MSVEEFNESAAASAIGTDLCQGKQGQIAPHRRWLSGLVLLGSAAAGDAAIELFVGSHRVGVFRNTSTALAPDMSKDFQGVGIGVLEAESVHAKITDVSGTTALRLLLYFSP